MRTVALEQSAQPTSVNVSLSHTWERIREIREQIAQVLQDSDASLRTAAVMVTSELVENAVKYGEAVPGAQQINVSLTNSPSGLVIAVTNGSGDAHAVAELTRRVDEITNAPDKSVPYMQRLEELLSNPTESGKLGLYRIAFEGKFAVRLSYVDQVVSMTATRSYP